MSEDIDPANSSNVNSKSERTSKLSGGILLKIGLLNYQI